ncbi:ATP-dependent DNA ligase [Nocardia niigatensis]
MPWFARIGRRLGVTRPSPALIRAAAACLYVFDLLGFGDRDLRTLTYLQRRERLERLGLPHGPVLLSPSYRDIPVSRMLAVAAEYDNEGVIARRVDSTYRAGRSQAWRKLPLRRSTEVVVVGGWPATPAARCSGPCWSPPTTSRGDWCCSGRLGPGSATPAARFSELHGQGHCSPLRNCATARVW